MRVLVDTCVLSEVQRKQGSARVREKFEALATEDIYFSVLTLGELRKGIDKLKPGAKKSSLDTWLAQITVAAQDRVLPIDRDTAMLWGEVTAQAEGKGRPLPAIDGLLAATALRHGLHLMTRNVADFEVTGVLLLNPWD